MLLLQTSLQCRSPLSSRSGIILVPVKAFELLHGLGISRFSPINCDKTTLFGIEWRQGGQFFPCRRRSNGKARQMRYIDAVLAMEPGTTYNTSQNHHTVLSTPSSQEQMLRVKSNNKHEVSMIMGTAQNHAYLNTAKPSAGGCLTGKLNLKELQKQLQEEKERERRNKISKANTGRTPWNKGKKGDFRINDEDSTSKTEVKEMNAEEKEYLRRQRISEANRGKVPWNKGGKHSPETKDRIRVGVIERMKDPKIRERLRLQAEAVQLSPDIRLKIKTGIIRAWNRKRKLRAKQELCLQEWKEVIAESARRGCEGEVEYHWNSYSIIKREGIKAAPKEKVRRPRPDSLSAEHRLRISEAIKAKWSNPEYRLSVEKGIRDSVLRQSSQTRPPRQTRPKAEPRQTYPRPSRNSSTTQKSTRSHSKGDLVRVPRDAKGSRKSAPKMHPRVSILSNPNQGKDLHTVRHGSVGSLKGTLRTDMMESDSLKPTNTDMPTYKDPEADRKLEKLRSMRARRMHVEALKQKEITERARALIAQAQEAAKALEAAAVKDKNALASLLETRKLLAEAVHSLESLKKFTPEHSIKEDNSALFAQVMSLATVVSSPSAKGDNHIEWESSNVESSDLHTYALNWVRDDSLSLE